MAAGSGDAVVAMAELLGTTYDPDEMAQRIRITCKVPGLLPYEGNFQTGKREFKATAEAERASREVAASCRSLPELLAADKYTRYRVALIDKKTTFPASVVLTVTIRAFLGDRYYPIFHYQGVPTPIAVPGRSSHYYFELKDNTPHTGINRVVFTLKSDGVAYTVRECIYEFTRSAVVPKLLPRS